jgi:CDGSH-type Zn-finger protein
MADVRITIQKDGSLKVEVEGTMEIRDHEGNVVPHREGKAVYLCRCGGSSRKPFCDGTHSKIGFAGAKAAVEAYQETKG